jgi:hypothetical protein
MMCAVSCLFPVHNTGRPEKQPARLRAPCASQVSRSLWTPPPTGKLPAVVAPSCDGGGFLREAAE